ncbi:MAG: HyaD/HybD family hydrogenase maturation endopeptidase [Desulfuromonadales bacterium]|nr:HyaD/HybD family hydrogenase maturation endopeptidase [Desulfuromonadales bacterium]
MNTLVYGAGNTLVSDEGFGVHLIDYLRRYWTFPEEVELLDGGTLGIMTGYRVEEADRLILVDVIDADGYPGEIRRYGLQELLLDRLPVKLSPHQIGIQEMLSLSALRGRLPQSAILFGVIPASYAAGIALSPPLAGVLPAVADLVVAELERQGHRLISLRDAGAPALRVC